MRKIFGVLVTVLFPLATPVLAQCPGGVCVDGFSIGGGSPSLMSTGWGDVRERFRIGPRGRVHYHRRERGFSGFGGGISTFSMPVVLGSGGFSSPSTFGASSSFDGSGGCYGGGFSSMSAQAYSAPSVLSFSIPERVVSYRISPPSISSAVVEAPRYYPLSSPQSVPSKAMPVPSKVTPKASPQTFTSPDLPPAMLRLPVPRKPSPQTPPEPPAPATEQASPPPAEPLPDGARRDEIRDLRPVQAAPVRVIARVQTPRPALAPPAVVVRSTVRHYHIPSVFVGLPPRTVVYYDGALFVIKDDYMIRR